MSRRRIFRNKQTAVIWGTVFTLLGFLFLYDAWEGRGGKKPTLLGPVLPW